MHRNLTEVNTDGMRLSCGCN